MYFNAIWIIWSEFAQFDEFEEFSGSYAKKRDDFYFLEAI